MLNTYNVILLQDVLNTSGNKCKITSCNENSHCKGNCLFKTRFEPRFGENRVPQSVVIRSATGSWYRPKSKKDIFDILKTIGSDSYRFVAGNTANGLCYVTAAHLRVLVNKCRENI